MNVLCVPSIGLDVSLLERLADSIDHPIKWKCVLNNGPTGALENFRNTHPDWYVKEPVTSNLGVAGSWNYFADWWSSEPAWLLANEDCYFLPGQLQEICEASDANLNEPLIYLNSSQAFYCFVWHAAGRRDFGDFDSNLFPAYYEDCDYRIRMRLSGKTEYVYALAETPVVPHGKPRSGGTNYMALIQGCGLLNRAYWRRKWGNDDERNPAYSTPYKDQRLTVKDWVWNPQHRSELFPLWREFLAQPKPSIYD